MTISYDFGELGQHLDKTVQSAKQLEDLLDLITADVKTLAGAWQGDASEGWQGEQAKWDAVAQKDRADLDQLIKAAGGATDAMKQAEKKIHAAYHGSS